MFWYFGILGGFSGLYILGWLKGVFARGCFWHKNLHRTKGASQWSTSESKKHPLAKAPFRKAGHISSEIVTAIVYRSPKGPHRTKIYYGIVNYYVVVFLLRPPYVLRREPLFGEENACMCQRRRGAIANHCAIVNLLRIVHLLRRSIFSTAGSFGLGSLFRKGPCPVVLLPRWLL